MAFVPKLTGDGREATGGLSGSGTDFHSRAIQAGLSTQIIITAEDANGDAQPIGAIQTLEPTEDRMLVRISEVGTDGVIQIVPQTATTIVLAVTRLVFDYQRLPAAFQRGFRHIHAARVPFDVVVYDYNPYQELSRAKEGDGDSGDIPSELLTTTYYNCWLQNYLYTYDQSNYLISESASIWAEGVATGPETKANLGVAEHREVGFSARTSVSPMSAAYAPIKKERSPLTTAKKQ